MRRNNQLRRTNQEFKVVTTIYWAFERGRDKTGQLNTSSIHRQYYTMGNRALSSQPKLGLIALARTMPLSKHQLVNLKQECVVVVSCGYQFQSSFTIDRHSFRLALLDILVEDSDTDILDSLFTMWDMMGNDAIHYREFLVGVSPLASGPRDSLGAILHYSLTLMDTSGSGRITPLNLTKVLTAINSTASYLGDNVLRATEIEEIVRDIYGSSMRQQTMSHNDVVPRLVMHAKVKKFMDGRGSGKYKLPEQNVLDAYSSRRAARESNSTSSKSRSETFRRLYEC